MNLEGDSKRGRVLDRVGAGAEAGFEFRRTGAESPSAPSWVGLFSVLLLTWVSAAFALFLGKFSLSENRKDQYDNNTITVMGERNLTPKF